MPRGALVLLPTIEQLNVKWADETLYVPRGGVMLHYDDSTTDAGGLGWFKHKDCKYGYTRYYLDDGDIVSIAPAVKRTPHAGLCVTPDANSYFYGLAAATNGKTLATAKQLEAILEDAARLFHYHAPEWRNQAVRLQGHHEQAMYGRSNTKKRELWGKRGRKVDPAGSRQDGKPIIDMSAARVALARRFTPI